MSMTAETLDARALLAAQLQGYSAEVTAREKAGVEAAPGLLATGAEIFIAAIPGETAERIIAAAVRLARGGLRPRPHIVARNLAGRADLDDMLARLAGEAGVDRCHVVGGDRDRPEGEFDSSLQLLQTGLFQKHGINRITVACYPEAHPRISDAVLEHHLDAKLALGRAEGLQIGLVSQFCFDAEPIIAMARRLRERGISAPLRAGVVGPADRGAMIRYGLMCGVGPSLRALKERHALARSAIAGETPQALLTELALAQAAEPSLGIDGVHFFTFGALARSTRFAEAMQR